MNTPLGSASSSRTGKFYTFCFTILISFITSTAFVQGQVSDSCADCTECSGIWTTLDDETGDFQRRHEASYVRIGDLFYLVGGRGNRTLAIYDPVTEQWSTGARPPEQLHHFQAVEVDGELWIAGAFIGNFPEETPFEEILIYNPGSDTWRTGPTIPRPRGSAGVVVKDRTLYLICGITNGHIDGHVPWLDAYNLDTETWSILPDAPRARDHYYAVLIENRIWNAAGRRTARNSDEGVLGNTVSEVDYYDLDNGSWGTLPESSNIPTPRAGTAAINYFGKVLVAGGESSAQTAAHSEMELLDPDTSLWSTLPPMIQGRHGTGLIQFGSSLYIASGSGSAGNDELDTQERYDCTGINASSEIELQSEPQSISTTPGEEETITLTFTNTSGNDLNIKNILIDGSIFSLSSSIPTVFNADENLELQVNFTPGAGGNETFQSILRIITDSETNPVFTVLLTGERSTGILKPRDIIYAINAGGGEYTANDGTVYAADQFFNGGSSFSVNSSNNPVAGTTDDILFNSERTGDFSYRLPIADGSYEVTLRFAELFWRRSGARSFSVNAEDAEVLTAADIFDLAGHDVAYDMTYSVDVTDGFLDLDFTPQR